MKAASRFVARFLCSIVILSLALANTETVHFQMEPEIVLAGPEIPHGALSLSKNKLNVVISSPPKVGESKTEWFRIEEPLDGAKYEVRACWPASSPSEFKLVHINDVVGVTVTPSFYSDDAALMEHPKPIEYQLVLNRLVFGVLAEDLVSTIALSTVGGLAALAIAFYSLRR